MGKWLFLCIFNLILWSECAYLVSVSITMDWSVLLLWPEQYVGVFRACTANQLDHRYTHSCLDTIQMVKHIRKTTESWKFRRLTDNWPDRPKAYYIPAMLIAKCQTYQRMGHCWTKTQNNLELSPTGRCFMVPLTVVSEKRWRTFRIYSFAYTENMAGVWMTSTYFGNVKRQHILCTYERTYALNFVHSASVIAILAVDTVFLYYSCHISQSYVVSWFYILPQNGITDTENWQFLL